MPKFYIFHGGKILLNEEGRVPESLPPLEDEIKNSGYVDRQRPDGDKWEELIPDAELPDGWTEQVRRDVWRNLGRDEFFHIAKAFHLMDWQRTHHFCGVCGAVMKFCDEDSSLRCPECGDIEYPLIAPAIIVAVEKDGRLLMGHNATFPEGRYSVLAGFVEVGESLEDCVRREIYEETAIRVKNIRYFGSQPWAFPHSLMVGFNAEWEGGEISPDGTEIVDAQWFDAHNIPDHYTGVSISAMLINDFIKRRG